LKQVRKDADEPQGLIEKSIYFFSNQAIKIVKLYPVFKLAKIMFIEDNTELIVDSCLISTVPDNTNTLSLGLLG